MRSPGTHGLRGCRVGEAFHPEPRQFRVIPNIEDDPSSTFLDDLSRISVY